MNTFFFPFLLDIYPFWIRVLYDVEYRMSEYVKSIQNHFEIEGGGFRTTRQKKKVNVLIEIHVPFTSPFCMACFLWILALSQLDDLRTLWLACWLDDKNIPHIWPLESGKNGKHRLRKKYSEATTSCTSKYVGLFIYVCARMSIYVFTDLF